MKKLMILAAVALVAAASQAASVKWTTSNVQNAAGTGTYSGTATLYAYLSSAEASSAVAVQTATMNAGTINKTFSLDTLEVGSTYKFFYKMVSGDYTFTSTEATRQMQAKATSPVGFGSSGSWKGGPEPEPTPEPTSAMLMLLGVAGLALKRKRA